MIASARVPILRAAALFALAALLLAARPAPAITPGDMDPTASPCRDFYQYADGGWLKSNPIPASFSRWGSFTVLADHNREVLKKVLDDAAAKRAPAGSNEQKIGDFYAACMDEGAVEKRGLSAIQPELDSLSQIRSAKEITLVVADLQRVRSGRSMLFAAGSTQDPDDSEHVIADVDQGGLSMPDRDYYIKDDAKSKETRQRYVQHIQKVFELIGDTPATAGKNAETVMRLETALAKASLTRVERRDPHKLVHKMKIAELAQLAPNFDWAAYYREMQYPEFAILNVDAPEFIKELNTLLSSESIDSWKTYLRFHIADSSSPYLASPFVEENFEFYRKYLRGAKEMQPRWRRCVQYVDLDLSEALGQVYVAKVFSPELKQSTVEMVQRIEDAMGQRIRALDWMSRETKQQALTKLAGIRNKIGYPDKWRDYSRVKIARDDFAGNVERTHEFENRRNINKIGKPVDHGEWDISAPTVDAYYNDQMNDINFPAGVLQPPLFDPKMDDAPNYGNTGGTIGHELTHGFDDEGSQYDAKGNLKDWWTKEDREKFDARTKCVNDQYSSYVSVEDVHVNGKLTLGENVADLGGEILAFMAWKDATKEKNLQPVDGLTPEQRFFVGYAQWDCANERPEDMRVRAMTDPHSPARYRINGVVVNMQEFAKAFNCKLGQPMVKPAANVCRVW
jgi:putative endopeptidase